jgi:DDE family transposase
VGCDDILEEPRAVARRLAQAFFQSVIDQAKKRGLLSDEHFTVDGTQIAAWASQKSFKRKGGEPGGPPPSGESRNPTVDFRGETRSNQTHQSTTDPDARQYTKAKGEAPKLCYIGNVVTENRNGLVVSTLLAQASGTAERDAAIEQLGRLRHRKQRITVGGDKAFDTGGFVAALRQIDVTPHVAQDTKSRASAIDARTTRHSGYEVSQRKRKRIEEVFGWMKTVGLLRKTRHRGRHRVGWMLTFTAAVYNLVRIRNLAEAVT